MLKYYIELLILFGVIKVLVMVMNELGNDNFNNCFVEEKVVIRVFLLSLRNFFDDEVVVLMMLLIF